MTFLSCHSFVLSKSGIWFSIPEIVPVWGHAGVAVIALVPLHRPLTKTVLTSTVQSLVSVKITFRITMVGDKNPY